MAKTIHRSMSYSSDYYPKYDTDGYPDMDGTVVGVYDGMTAGDKDGSGSLVSYKTLAMNDLGYTQAMLDANKGLKQEVEDKMIEFIEADLAAADGWMYSGGEWAHADHGKLDYVFTIAGDTTDHPAYAMFENAAALLSKCGFKISVQQDLTALRKLTEGKLAVWAAAWSSTIDPDMYQVYHKDSTATSIKNWGYDEIFNPNNTVYEYEKTLITDLSDLIEQGRETLDVESRFNTYCLALDYVMELAVELPTYQRKDMYVFNKDILDASTLNTTDVDGYAGVLDRIWELNYN
jgi:peptide/nickel transport system substrate-binding protein